MPNYQGASVTPNGTQISTMQVSNVIAGDKELQLTFTCDGTGDQLDLLILPGIMNLQDNLPAKVTMSSPYFRGYDELRAYFAGISTNIYGVRIETDDVDNFMSNLSFKEKDPTGKDVEVSKFLSKYRVNNGSGYSETIELTENDLNITKWSGLSVSLSKLKKSTSVTFYFKVRGWNKSQILSALQPDIIG